MTHPDDDQTPLTAEQYEAQRDAWRRYQHIRNRLSQVREAAASEPPSGPTQVANSDSGDTDTN